MLIRKCIASLPGLFQNRSFEFTEGLNIIVGKNASGKSFLSRALTDTAGFNLGPRPLLRTESWENAYLELEIENSGHRYQLIRNGMELFSVRHFDRDRVDLLFDGPPRGPDNPERAGAIWESVKTIAGDPSMHDLHTRIDPGSFGAVSFVMAPMDISNNGLPGADALRRLFLWDTSGFYRLYSSLKNHFGHDAPRAAHGTVRDSLHSVEGQLRDIEKTIQIMDIRKSKKQKLLRELEQVDQEISGFDREADEIAGEKSDLAGLVKKIEAAGAAAEKIHEIEAELRRYEKLTETVARKEKEITEKFSQFRDFNERKKTNLRRLQEIYRKIRDLNASLDDISFSRNSKKRRTHYISFFMFIIFLGMMYLVNISRVPGFDARTQPLVNYLLAGGTALTVAMLYLSLFFPRLK
ncbi:MAG TPA: hypothetical protein ENN21_09695, partial [Spirochaetes bacterium]|nr:hypothetical protein [Spirochaetota bacterium]